MPENEPISKPRLALRWIKGQPVLLVSALAAFISAFFAPPSGAYLGYINWHTILCLFAMLCVLNGLRAVGALGVLAQALVVRLSTARSAIIALVMIVFVGSMFFTNDIALLTFLPLTAVLLSSCGQQRYLLFTFTMETIAANLGGMILPFGNPQNLFLFSHYGMSLESFVNTLLPPFVLALVMILACCLVVAKPTPLAMQTKPDGYFNVRSLVVLLVLFALVICMVFSVIPEVPGAVIVVLALIISGQGEALKHVDYALLLTFVCFFIFSGNLASLQAVQDVLSGLLADGAFLPSLLISQIISNVPAAVLLAPFTTDWPGLLLGVDVGGVGTVVASLASLITMAEYQHCVPGQRGRFLAVFSAFNFAFLAVLAVFVLLFVAP